jgi:hypothetical protein
VQVLIVDSVNAPGLSQAATKSTAGSTASHVGFILDAHGRIMSSQKVEGLREAFAGSINGAS